jgi:hypothetical protein
MATKTTSRTPEYFSNLGRSSWDKNKDKRDSSYFSAIAAKSHPRKVYSGRRPTTKMITYKNKTQSIADWAKQIGISKSTLYGRINTYKWPLSKALKK